MPNMLSQEQLVDIYVLHRQGKGIRAIARELGISRNTVKRYLKQNAPVPRYSPRPGRVSLLEPFKPYLQERIRAAHPHWIPATVLLREIQTQGYQGKAGILRNYLRPFKQPVAEA